MEICAATREVEGLVDQCLSSADFQFDRWRIWAEIALLFKAIFLKLRKTNMIFRLKPENKQDVSNFFLTLVHRLLNWAENSK